MAVFAIYHSDIAGKRKKEWRSCPCGMVTRGAFFPGKFPRKGGSKATACSGEALGWLIILVLSVKHSALSIFLSPCAKMPSSKISIINDTVKSLARKSQVLFSRKLVRRQAE